MTSASAVGARGESQVCQPELSGVSASIMPSTCPVRIAPTCLNSMNIVSASPDPKTRATFCTGTGRQRQQGAVSIEFAFMFVILFMIFYGIIGYVTPLMLLSSYNEISAEAVRAAVLVPDNQPDEDYEEKVRAVVNSVIEDSWLGDRDATWKSACSGESYVTFPDNLISVCIAHNDPKSIIPPIKLFGWEFPQLPSALIGEANIRLR